MPSTHAWYTCLVHMQFRVSVRLLLLHTLLSTLDIMAAAFAIHMLISATNDKLLVILEPRYLKLSTTSNVTLSMLIDGGITTSCHKTFVFLMLMVSPISLQAWKSLSVSCWISSSV